MLLLRQFVGMIKLDYYSLVDFCLANSTNLCVTFELYLFWCIRGVLVWSLKGQCSRLVHKSISPKSYC
jgi:hypothetical protein